MGAGIVGISDGGPKAVGMLVIVMDIHIKEHSCVGVGRDDIYLSGKS